MIQCNEAKHKACKQCEHSAPHQERPDCKKLCSHVPGPAALWRRCEVVRNKEQRRDK